MFCSFRENLIARVLSDIPFAGTVFIFPTEANKNIALKNFQAQWHFSQTLFLTMEEFKELCFYSNRPLIIEEKRTLALYGSLTEKDKIFFNLNNYFQSLETAQHLFDLWEEFNEELVDEKKISREKFAALGVELSEWQKKTFERLKTIKRNYKNFLMSKKVDDVIFLYTPSNINFFQFNNFQRFVILNQFYYTGLEKKIINRLAESGKDVSIYYQMSESLVDKTNLNVRSFSMHELHECQYKNLTIVESKNDFSMITSLLEHIKKKRGKPDS